MIPLKTRCYNVDIGLIPISEWNATCNSIRKQLEIDFVCNQGSKRYYIQSAFSFTEEMKIMQEQKALLLTCYGFKKIIITKDALAPLYNENGVLILGILDFLLNQDSLDI